MVKRTKKVIEATSATEVSEISVIKSVLHDITNPQWRPTVTAENRLDLMFEVINLTMKIPSAAIRKDAPFKKKLGEYIKEITRNVHFTDIASMLHEIALKINADRGLVLTLIDVLMEFLYLVMLSKKKGDKDDTGGIE